jgi:UDP-2,3-diacylglucosamine pyrophosphatase LpxH
MGKFPQASAWRAHAPDRVADIVGHQQRTLLVDGHAHRPTEGLAVKTPKLRLSSYD